nr:hypothetical protein CFP56_30150 [Quercus suber]
MAFVGVQSDTDSTIEHFLLEWNRWTVPYALTLSQTPNLVGQKKNWKRRLDESTAIKVHRDCKMVNWWRGFHLLYVAKPRLACLQISRST